MARRREGIHLSPLVHAISGIAAPGALDTGHLTFTVPAESSGQRLDVFVARHCPDLSRARAQRLIKEGHVHVNGAAAKPSHVVREGETVTVEMEASPTAPPTVTGQDIPLEVLHEDDDVLVINKPRGMVVHPAAGNWSGTLVNALLGRGEPFSTAGGGDRPGIVHRLDKDTSGVMVVAKNDRAHHKLAKQFQERKVEKRYLALVCGEIREASGIVRAPIGRHPVNRQKMVVLPTGRDAITEYVVQERFKDFTLVECHPLTGRTHQIRVHLSYIYHPVVGDDVYGGRARALQAAQKDAPLSRLIAALSGQALHAAALAFNHPTGGRRLTFAAPMPQDMADILERLKTTGRQD
ncbi:MAG: RluA family pseudouridine synthase [Abditibacteriales bacterium]|nr:RluA family pseudouridine synthase [Abditibacteriales bacterium]MDW8365344.1 RluA family pseudouridine synthase [Abditibacteriales bacterium]